MNPRAHEILAAPSSDLPTPSPTPVPTPPPTAQPTPEPTAEPGPQPTPPPPPPPRARSGPVPVPVPAGENVALAQRLEQLINQVRVANGLPPVTLNVALTNAAEKYAQYSFLNSDPYQLNHYLDGGPGDRAAAEGYYGAIGEILATSPPDAPEILNLWLNSPAHRSIIMDGTYRDIGMGCYQALYGGFQIALCDGDFGAP